MTLCQCKVTYRVHKHTKLCESCWALISSSRSPFLPLYCDLYCKFSVFSAWLKLKCSSSHYILLRLFPHFLPVSKSLIEFLCFTTQEVSVVPWDLSLLPGPCSHGFSCLASSMPILWLDLLSSGAKNTKITIFPPIIYALVHSGLLSTVLQLLTCDTCLWVSVLMVCVVVTPHNILLHH